MNSLPHYHHIKKLIGEIGFFRRLNSVENTLMPGRLCNLSFADIASEYQLKMFGKRQGKLTASAGAIPNHTPVFYQPADVFYKGIRVFRPEFGIIPGMARKKVFNFYRMHFES